MTLTPPTTSNYNPAWTLPFFDMEEDAAVVDESPLEKDAHSNTPVDSDKNTAVPEEPTFSCLLHFPPSMLRS